MGPLLSEIKENDLDVLGKYIVTVKCQYTEAIKTHKRNLRIYQYLQQGQAPGKEIHPGGVISAQLIKGQKAHLLTGYEEAWP